MDLDELAEAEGRLVRVGGLVVDLGPDRFRVDDGTAVGTIVLTGSALGLLDLLDSGDPVNVTGTVVKTRRQLGHHDRGSRRPARSSEIRSHRRQRASSPAPHRYLSPGPGSGRGLGRVVQPGRLRPPGHGWSGRSGLRHAHRDDASSRSCVTLVLRQRRSDRALSDRVAARLAAFRTGGQVAPADGPVAPDRVPRQAPASRTLTHARSTQLDAREKAGLSSPEFRASGAATRARERSCRTRISAASDSRIAGSRSRRESGNTTSDSAQENWPSTSSSPATQTGPP